MPFLAIVNGTFGYGRAQQLQGFIPSGLPAYYTSTSGYFMYQPGYNATQLDLKSASDLSGSAVIRSYTGLQSAWTYIHDKDLDTNVYYGMTSFTRVLRKYELAKGGTTVTTTTLTTYTGATTEVLGACYAPACMWTSSTGYGAFIIGGFSQGVIHVLEFTSSRTIGTTYRVPYTSEVYGTEVIPKDASGFNNNYGVAYTRASKQMSSWTVDMSTRSWTNRKDNSYLGGETGPSNGDGMIYYPPGKPIFTGDPDTSTNRIAMNDATSSYLYVWTITESGTQLNWTYLTVVEQISLGGYPYSMSVNAYNSVA